MDLRRTGDFAEIQDPHNGGNGQWEVQTNEEAQVYVYDLDLFVTVQLLEDTPAVLSLGKLCEEHGFTSEWASGQTPHLTKQGKEILCKTENVLLMVVPGLSSNCGTSASPTSPSQDSSSTPSSTPSSPASERSDELAPGNCSCDPSRDQSSISDDRLRDLPEWLEEFTENLGDTEVRAHAHISHDSDSDRPTKVASKKHYIFTQFPKDRNCEVCWRTKMTRAPCRRRTGETPLLAESLVT